MITKIFSTIAIVPNALIALMLWYFDLSFWWMTPFVIIGLVLIFLGAVIDVANTDCEEYENTHRG